MMARAPPKKPAKVAKAPVKKVKKAAPPKPVKKVVKKVAPKKVVKKVAKKAPAKKAPAKKAEPGVRFWAPGFGAGPLPNNGQIFFSDWSFVKQAFSLELVGGAQGNVKSR